MSNETWHRLLEWTSGQAPSEFLAAQAAHAERFEDYDPSHPVGGRDGGRDAVATRDGRRYTVAVYFPRGQQSPKTTREKLVADYAGAAANHADGMLVVTNQEMRLAERAAVQEAVGGELVLLHLAKLASILDRPAMHAVRQEFLGIPAVVPTALSSPERLEELRRASISRCAARWSSAGVDKSVADALSTDDTFGSAPAELVPDTVNRVIVWTAAMGSGKSIAAERVHQAAISSAATARNPLPAFVSARAAAVGLDSAVLAATVELGNARTVGACIVVDGVDEVGFEAAESLLLEARALVGTWPTTTVLLTARPIDALTSAPENRTFPQLDEAAQRRCIAIGSGGSPENVRLLAYPADLRPALRLPLFALLAGTWQRDNHGLPTAPIDLLRILGLRASKNQNVDEAVLRRLAIESVADELGPVPLGEIVETGPAEALLATGLVSYRDGALNFSLPSVAQWFAAQGLLAGDCTVEELLASPADLDLWLYPLALALSVGSADAGHRLVSPMMESVPGFGFRVLSTTFDDTTRSGGVVPGWRRAGSAIRRAGHALTDGLGPLARLVLDVDNEGVLLPLCVARENEKRLIVAVSEDRSRDAVSQLGLPFDRENLGKYRRVRSAGVARTASWGFGWLTHEIRRSLDEVLGNWGFPLPADGPLMEEALWAGAADLSTEVAWDTQAIEIAPLLARLEDVPADWDAAAVHLGIPGRFRHDLGSLRHQLVADVGAGKIYWRSPLPGPDRTPGAIVGDEYSPERWKQRIRSIFERALIGYEQLVMQWLPTLAPRMEHHVLRPAKLHIGLGQHGPGSEGLPFHSRYLEPLPPGSPDEVVIEHDSRDLDFDLIFRKVRSARPADARWLEGSFVSEAPPGDWRFPVHTVVYKWIAEDLRRIGLVSSQQFEPQYGSAPSTHSLRTRRVE